LPLQTTSLIGQAAALMLSPEADTVSTLVNYFSRPQSLLVLDNCEHVLAGCATLCALLRQCPYLQILATSREALGVDGDWTPTAQGAGPQRPLLEQSTTDRRPPS
jgi:predicted ATPase